MIDRYAVMGNPIAHSKSPFIHTAFAKQTQQDLVYAKIEVPINEFEEYIQLFQRQSGKGLNITLPFKPRAFELVTECSDRAVAAKAVNTIKFLANGKLFGDNTDGVGFIRDLTIHHQFALQGKKILILGAGGAVRGILKPVLDQGPKSITIANRTLATAKELEHEFDVQALSLDQLSESYDLVINGTSVGLANEAINLNPLILTTETFCYDLMYGQEHTPFLKWAVAQGATHTADGIGMLVEQAAESFYIWRGVRPETLPVIEQLKFASSE